MRAFTLELPDETAATLERWAREGGQTTAEVIIRLVGAEAPCKGEAPLGPVEEDSLFHLQSYDIEVPTDLSENADRYLYPSDAK